MNDEQVVKIVGEHFNVHEYEEGQIELETWTTGGVNMFITLDPDERKTFLEQFKEYVEDFDVDEQVDLHREGDDYRKVFSVRQSLEDFEAYEKFLEKMVAQLEEAAVCPLV